MLPLAKGTWTELKLFGREPLTVVFTMALPLVMLFVLGSVFGNTPDEDVYRGVGAMDYYVPAYIGLVAASLGLVGLPVHLAGYRELGVLRRFRASPVPLWSLFGSQILVTVLVAAVGGALVVAVSAVSYDISAPASLAGVLAAFGLSALAFAAVGLLLGALLPTARAAQGAGVLLWFVMLIISGAGPPPEVLSEAMRTVADLTPLRHVITLIQDPWLGLGWNAAETLIVLGYGAGAVLVSLLLLRREGVRR